MGTYLYMCFRVSEATGCVVVVIHHEGKTSGENPKQGIERLRGSSAIAAAAGAVVSFVKDGTSGCIRIEHVRANLGAAAEPVVIRLVDEGELDPVTEKSEGLRIEHMPPEQLRAEASTVSDVTHENELHDLCARALLSIRRHQDTPDGMRGAKQLRALLHIGEAEARRVWEYLIETGAITGNLRQGKAARWRISSRFDGTPEPTEGGE